MRRLVLAAAAVGVIVAGPATEAMAQSLSDYFERGAEAEFSGSQAIRCITPDGHRDVIVDLAQGGGGFSAFAAADGGHVAVAGGTLAVVRPDGSSAGMAVVPSDSSSRGGYSLEQVGSSSIVGRAVTEVSVLDGRGVTRAVLGFDVGTGALLGSQIFNGDGSVYCETRMITFEEGPVDPEAPAREADIVQLEQLGEGDGDRLPDELAGFRLLDVYRWESGGAVGFYSDGLFSFSLLATGRPVELGAENVSQVQQGSGSYTRWFGPGQVVLVWDTADGGLALSGDLPLDLLDSVLGELPGPRAAGIFSRVWSSLFG